MAEASKWPPTYAEISKGGAGIHLHYIYTGDVTKLSRIFADEIEIKVFTGKSSLRRKLTKCNNLPIATISSGLPLKEEKKMVSGEVIKSERSLRELIKRNLLKEIHPGTKPSMDFIVKILDDAYSSGLKYDVSDMKNAIIGFAAQSSNHSDYCLKLVDQIKAIIRMIGNQKIWTVQMMQIQMNLYFMILKYSLICFLLIGKYREKDDQLYE